MPETPPDRLGEPSRSPTLTLRDACRKAVLDQAGQRCSGCKLRCLCASETRWLVGLRAPLLH